MLKCCVQGMPAPKQPQMHHMNLQYLGNHGFLTEDPMLVHAPSDGLQGKAAVRFTGSKWVLVVPESDEPYDTFFSWDMAAKKVSGQLPGPYLAMAPDGKTEELQALCMRALIAARAAGL